MLDAVGNLDAPSLEIDAPVGAEGVDELAGGDVVEARFVDGDLPLQRDHGLHDPPLTRFRMDESNAHLYVEARQRDAGSEDQRVERWTEWGGANGGGGWRRRVLSGQPSTDVGCELQVVVEPIIMQLVVNVLVLLKAIAVFDESCREGTGREGEG